MRSPVLQLYRQGRLATLQEGAWIAAVTRQRIMAWLAAEGIDHQATRKRYLAQIKHRADMYAAGKRPKRQTKAQARAETARLVSKFKAKGGRVRRL